MRTMLSARQAASPRSQEDPNDPSRQKTMMDCRHLMHEVIGKGEPIVLVRAPRRLGDAESHIWNVRDAPIGGSTFSREFDRGMSLDALGYQAPLMSLSQTHSKE